MNKRKTYAIINAKTKKILKYEGKSQYFRTYTLALIERRRLQNELKTKLEVKKCI